MADKKLEDLDIAQRDDLKRRVAARAAQRRQRREERFVEDLVEVCKSVSGRRMLWDLMSESGVFHDPFVPGDANATHVNIGNSRMGRKIFKDLTRHLPDVYARMTNEHVAERKQEKAEDNAILQEVAKQ